MQYVPGDYDHLNKTDPILNVIDLEKILEQFILGNYGAMRLMEMLFRVFEKADPERKLPLLGRMLKQAYIEWLKSR